MGLFSFLKSAGKKTAASVPSSSSSADNAPDLAQELRNAVTDLDLDIKYLSLQVKGDKVRISGTAATQADREKAILAVGNVHGIAEVEDNIEVIEAEPEAQFYEVKSGDSLSKIAKQFYGDAMKYPVIFEANKPMLTDPDKIYPGQSLRIPPLDKK